jgi:hypothetical protein
LKNTLLNELRKSEFYFDKLMVRECLFQLSGNKGIFSFFPNPAGEYIEISGLNKGLQPLVQNYDAIKIFNMLGECVLSTVGTGGTHPLIPSQEGNIRIDVSDLQSGVYFIRVGDWVGRFVKI